MVVTLGKVNILEILDVYRFTGKKQTKTSNLKIKQYNK